MISKIEPKHYDEFDSDLSDIWSDLENLKSRLYFYGIDFGDQLCPLLKAAQEVIKVARDVGYRWVDEKALMDYYAFDVHEEYEEV